LTATLRRLETASNDAPPALSRQDGSCDVQEQQNSGVQPELTEHERTCSWVTAPFGQGRAAIRYLVRSTTIHAPGQERVKGNELGGGIPLCQASRRLGKGRRSSEPRRTYSGSREVVRREAACFERQRRLTTSRETGTRPDTFFVS
jgi:hypothetical protein